MVRVNMPYYTCDMCGSTNDVKKVSVTIAGEKSSGDLCKVHRKPLDQLVNRFAMPRGPVAHLPLVPYETFQRQAAQGRGARKADPAPSNPLSSQGSETIPERVDQPSGGDGSSPENTTTARRRRGR